LIYYQSKEDRCQIFLILDYKRSRISLLFFISLLPFKKYRTEFYSKFPMADSESKNLYKKMLI